MPTDRKKRNILLQLAAEGVVPVIGGCAGAIIGGPVGGLAGVVVAQSVEKAINLFGKGIVEKWRAWFVGARPEERAEAVADLAVLPPQAAREKAREMLIELAPDAEPHDLSIALEYLSSLPRSLSRALVLDLAGQKSLPPTVTWDDEHSLLQLLPQDIPPYATSVELPGTPYRLEELLGSGGFGAVYRASSPTLQHLPLALKFCLDRSAFPALNLERSNLERLMRAAGERGSGHVVKLYGYDLDHATPYLVYEYVPGGDLTGHLTRHRAETGRAMTPADVFGAVTQLTEGLAFAHRAGLVHRDIKPANVLVDGNVLKLADFGLGGVAVRRAVERSRIGATTIDYLSLAERASLFRGAGTPLYMSPEQRRGANPDPRHDLYSLGVLWFQLLAGDVTRELHPGWAKELAVRFGVPAGHIALIDHCVGWFDERPKDASELLPLFREAESDATSIASAAPVSFPFAQTLSRPMAETQTAVVTPSVIPAEMLSKHRLLELLRKLQEALASPTQPAAALILGWAAAFFVILTVVVGAIVAQDRDMVRDGSFVLVALAIGTPLTAVFGVSLFIGLRRRATRRHREAVDSTLTTTSAEFPAEVEAWGGPDRLRSPAVVSAVLEQVANPSFRVSPASAPVSTPIAPRQPPSRPQAPPFWAAVALAAILGGLVGVGAGLLTDRLTAPLRGAGYDLYDTSGELLNQDRSYARRRMNAIMSPVVGVSAGLLATALGTWALSRPRRFLWPTVGAAFFGLFVLGAPAGIAVYNFVDLLIAPNRGGQQLSEIRFAQAARRVEILGGLACAATALLLAAATASITRWRYRVMGRMAEPEPGEAPPPPTFTPAAFRGDPMQVSVLSCRLRQYHERLDDAGPFNWVSVSSFTWGWIAVLGVAWGVGYLVEEAMRPHADDVTVVGSAILAGLVMLAGLILLNVIVRRRAGRALRTAKADLIADYGPVFAEWGGPGFLDDGPAVEAAIEQLNTRYPGATNQGP